MRTLPQKNAHTRASYRSRALARIMTLLLIMAFPAAANAALSCNAAPGTDGNTSVSGTPSTLRYYQPTASATAGSTSISVSNTVGLAAGDMVLVIQMQGAAINATNTDSYGDGASGNPASGVLNNSDLIAGRYEYNAVASTGAGTINLALPLANSYVRADATTTAGRKRYQVIRVPQYNNLNLVGELTAPAWNGETGGVLALDVANNLNFNGNTINMNAKGFRGGGALLHTGTTNTSYTNNDFRNNAGTSTTGAHASKAEGIVGTPRRIYNDTTTVDTGTEGYPNGSYGMGAPGNAGGGGTDGNRAANDQNSGGGGGGNGGAGGRGGYTWSSTRDTGGFGGAAFSAAANRIVMGGGGGAGTGNNAATTLPHGGVGGGIVLIRAGQIIGSGNITSNGGNGNSPVVTNDAAGGGGAGGSVILLANGQTGSIAINARGGNGGNADPGGAAHGPGGGGGGGVVFSNNAISPTTNVSQGSSGFTVTPGNFYGASPSGGNAGNGIPNTDPDDVDGNSPGSDCSSIQADLSISKSLNNPLLQAGSAAQFLLSVSNAGPDTVTVPIVVNDVLDSRFSYTSFSGSGWSCVQSPAQTITCSHNGPLASGASLPDLLLDVDITASPASASVSNTASVSFNNNTPGSFHIDINLANNSSTINDFIYGATITGNKLLYTYPTSATAGTLQRVVPASDATQTIGEASSMNLDLSPALQSNLVINNNISVSLCMRREGSTSSTSRTVTATLRRADTNAVIGSTPTNATVSSDTWEWYTFTINHTGPTTIPSGVALRLQISNSSSGSGTRSVGITSNAGGGRCSAGISLVGLDTSTVINIDTVGIYSAASPLGSLITQTVENATVYIRSTVTDPFGHADINNNSTVEVLDNTGTVVSGPHDDTAIISQTGNTKVFEYAVTLPADREAGPFVIRARAKEGTEETISHYNATTITLTDPPLLMVSKVASQSSASPGNDIAYTVLVSNTHVLGTGDASGVTAIDKLPPFASFKLGSIVFTDGPAPYAASTLTGTIQYSNDNGTSWTYTPVSAGGGAPAGYDANVTHFRILFSGSMPANAAFRLDYILRVD